MDEFMATLFGNGICCTEERSEPDQRGVQDEPLPQRTVNAHQQTLFDGIGDACMTRDSTSQSRAQEAAERIASQTGGGRRVIVSTTTAEPSAGKSTGRFTFGARRASIESLLGGDAKGPGSRRGSLASLSAQGSFCGSAKSLVASEGQASGNASPAHGIRINDVDAGGHVASFEALVQRAGQR